MRSALSSVPGVYDVQVDYAAKTAEVVVDKNAAPTEEALATALQSSGFGLSQ